MSSVGEFVLVDGIVVGRAVGGEITFSAIRFRES